MTSASQCPIDHHANKHLTGAEDLLLPLHKRCIVQYSENDQGNRELHIYYDDKEISFDEPEWFAFGEALAKQSQFIARSATEWGNNSWSEIRPLLEELLAEGILKRAEQQSETDIQKRNAHRPSPLPPAQTDKVYEWRDCNQIVNTLTGRSLEIGHLELVLPLFRIAHIALDAEGRQVGEANVFPAALRLDIETEWRTCPYSGSRYLDQRPMNVTALRSMSTYWPQMMGALRLIRAAYLERYPQASDNWTVGSIEALSSLVLAVPTFQLMRNDHPVKNGTLHPALASMFRVTDGLRMVTHQMIFVPVGEPTLPVNTPMTVNKLYEYSERNYAFSSAHGVCAGPKVMIEEFLNVLINGHRFDGLDTLTLEPEVNAALDDLPKALDYGLLGLQAHVVSFSIWPAMTRCYVELHQISSQWSLKRPAKMLAWKQRLQGQFEVLNSQTHHSSEALRINREQAYADIYQHCALGLNPDNSENLLDLLKPELTEQHQVFKTELLTILSEFCEQDITEATALLDCLMLFLLKSQAILKLAERIQKQINTLLERQDPQQAFQLDQIDIHNLLQGVENRRLAFLLSEINEIFDIRILVTAESIRLKK